MAQYEDFIVENVALSGTRRIGIYNSKGCRVGFIPLDTLTPPTMGQKLYSFGALSDVHIGASTAENDFKAALSYLSENTDFINICGDLIDGWWSDDFDAHIASQIESYISCVEVYASVPVYAIAGNHDGAYVADIETAITDYTGQPLYYSVFQGNDVFIFAGIKSDAWGSLFTQTELQWLYETLEANRNKRCFLFQHVRPDDACGNALGIYTYDIWGGTEQTIFESLLKHYKNIVLFHGHSHLRFNMQQYSDLANIDRNFGCWSVHVPSISVPRDTLSVVDPSITTIYAESEGYVVDVYKNGIHLRGRDFVKGEFLPIASYWLDTTLQTVEAGTYTDPTGTITLWPEKYLNLVPSSIDTDGTIYNGCGYIDGYRLSSSGALKAQANSAATGFIKATKTDVVRMAGVKWLTTEGYNYFAMYDESFNLIETVNYSKGETTQNGWSYNSKGALDRANTYVYVENDITRFDIALKDGYDYAYIRISAYGSGADMIITVNEEIT